MVYVIVKKYEHFNRSFKSWDSSEGKYIRSKKHYQDTMRQQGMIPQGEADRMVEAKQSQARDRKLKPSQATIDILAHAQQIAGRGGKLKLGDRAIKKMIEVGAIQDMGKVRKQLARVEKEGGL